MNFLMSLLLRIINGDMGDTRRGPRDSCRRCRRGGRSGSWYGEIRFIHRGPHACLSLEFGLLLLLILLVFVDLLLFLLRVLDDRVSLRVIIELISELQSLFLVNRFLLIQRTDDRGHMVNHHSAHGG